MYFVQIESDCDYERCETINEIKEYIEDHYLFGKNIEIYEAKKIFSGKFQDYNPE